MKGRDLTWRDYWNLWSPGAPAELDRLEAKFVSGAASIAEKDRLIDLMFEAARAIAERARGVRK